MTTVVEHYMSSDELHGSIERPELAGRKKLHICRISITNTGIVSSSFTNSDILTLNIECRVYQRIREAQIAFDFSTSAGDYLFSSTHQDSLTDKGELLPGEYLFQCPIDLTMFRQGQYKIAVASSVPGVEMLDLVNEPLVFEIFDDSSPILRLGQERRGLIVPRYRWSIFSKGVEGELRNYP
ncbi:MAG: Wzt carbohydrate-binding domain-containing protein [Chloroflexi bacterium]|nr:Wzt carbohydrate-binding domain-containing protein [Chloroflexota bacterium]